MLGVVRAAALFSSLSGVGEISQVPEISQRGEISQRRGEISQLSEISHSLRYLSRMRYLTSPLSQPHEISHPELRYPSAEISQVSP